MSQSLPYSKVPHPHLPSSQMLCSIATLIHDSYLPIYAQDVLGLSNTSIGAVQGIAQFLCQLTKGVSGVVGDLLGSQVSDAST